jgi:small subunit ribosomal protein S20
LRRNKSGVKRVAIAERNRQRNISAKSAARTAMKKLILAAANPQSESTAVLEALGKAYGLLDKAVLKGILHKNTVARYKSKLGLAANQSKAVVAV